MRLWIDFKFLKLLPIPHPPAQKKNKTQPHERQSNPLEHCQAERFKIVPATRTFYANLNGNNRSLRHFKK